MTQSRYKQRGGGNTAKQANDARAVRYRGKTSHLCDDEGLDAQSGLWHAIVECSATNDRPDIASLRTSESSAAFLLKCVIPFKPQCDRTVTASATLLTLGSHTMRYTQQS
jgi:hypothetical protein